MLYCVSLSKAGAKLRTFSQTPTFTRLFFDRFSKFFRKTLENRYVTRHIFSADTEGGGKHAQLYLLRGRAHVREGKHTALSAKSGTMEKQRLLFIKTTAYFHLKYTFFLKNYSIFFQHNEQADYQQLIKRKTAA